MTSLLTCKEFVNWLNEYLDETATAEEREQLEEHVNSCPNCWVVFDTTKKTIQVFKGMEPQPLPETVHERLMNAIQKKMAEKH